MEEFSRPEVSVNLYKKANPLSAVLVENKRLVPESNEDGSDVRHLVFEVKDYPYLEGQSVGVLAPGETAEGKPHAVRLYSIASLGNDNPRAEKLSLCVKRAETIDDQGVKHIGVCSTYLCDLKVGDTVNMTGPAGRKFLLPAEKERNRDYIFIATGTGIAPFRGMVQRLLKETPGFSGEVALLFGVRRSDELLYDSEFTNVNHGKFYYLTAKSREQKSARGGRYYVGDLITDHADLLWPMLKKPETLIYLCGLKGMEDGIREAIIAQANQAGLDGEQFYSSLHHRLTTEVY